MQKYEYKQLKITELLLNVQNPRFDTVNYQSEAIHAMIIDQGDKLIELAKHITINGLSPMEIILVQPHGELWLVREGNRRVTALKLINEPELIPAEFSKMKKEFLLLNKSIDDMILDNIQCAIISDEKIINEWIRLKHTGENKGIGTVSWDAQQTSRFVMQTSKKKDPKSSLFEELRNDKNVPNSVKAKFSNIKKTNFDRLIGDPSVRNFLGIEDKDGQYDLSNGIYERIITILLDLAGEFSVGHIYTKKDRNNYINEVNTRIRQQKLQIDTDISQSDFSLSFVDLPNDKISNEYIDVSNEDIINNSPADGTSITNKDRDKINYPINRKTLIPSIQKLSITKPRIVRIFRELKSLDCEKYVNSVSVLFRVFIELSCDWYISNYHLAGVSVKNKLSEKVQAIINDLKSKNIMTDHELRAAQRMVSSENQNQSVKTFHSYVHNMDLTPSSKDLQTAWDDLFPFIENIWR